MTQKQYLLLLKRQLQSKKVICGYNQDNLGQAIITIGSPRKYNDDKVTYVDKKIVSEFDYIKEQMKSTKRI